MNILKLLKIPGILFEDNEGAKFVVGNKQVSRITNHIALKKHYIREFTKVNDGVEQGRIMKI